MSSHAPTPVLVDLALFQKADDDAIEGYVTELPRERVVEALLLVTTLRKALGTAEKMLTSRIEAETLIGVGEIWISPADQREFMWTGDRRRECADPEGLRAALTPLVNESSSLLAIRALREAFKPELKTYISKLDEIARFAPETESTIRDFISWKEGGRKLRPLDEEGR